MGSDADTDWSIGVERADGIVTITLLGLQGAAELSDDAGPRRLNAVLLDVAQNPKDRAVVLTGEFWECRTPTAKRLASTACRALHDLPQPTVAEVHGFVSGAGVHLVLACDLVVASEESVFSIGSARQGLSHDDRRMAERLVGPKSAQDLAMMSGEVDPRRMESLGLLNRVLPGSEVHEVAFAWAQRLAAGPQDPIALNKMLLNAASTVGLEQALDHEAMSRDVIFADDRTAALLAFLEPDDQAPDIP